MFSCIKSVLPGGVAGNTANTMDSIIFDDIPRQGDGVLTVLYEDPTAAVVAAGVAHQLGGGSHLDYDTMTVILAHCIVGDRSGGVTVDDHPKFKIAFREIVCNRGARFGADDEAMAAIVAHDIVPHRGLRASPRAQQPKPIVVGQQVVGEHHPGGRAPNGDAIGAVPRDLVLPEGDVRAGLDAHAMDPAGDREACDD